MLEDAQITCPYCWQQIAIGLDLSAGSQTYVEDCSVCCHPILLRLQVDDTGAYRISAEAENE